MKQTCLSVLLLLLVKANCLGQSNTDEAKDLVTSMIETYMKLPKTPPGISVAVSKGESTVFSKGFGYADIGKKKRVTPETRFRAGSLSRAMTTLAFVKLVEEGKMRFEAPVFTYLPDYPEKKYSFTVKQLASGLSGMAHYSKEDRLEDRQYESVEDALQVFSHVPLLHPPGESYQYSIHGFTLLSRGMEKASGQDFLSLLRKKVFDPLGMSSTQAETWNNPEANQAMPYAYHADGILRDLPTEIIQPKNYSYSWAAVGMISTPTDLTKMANGLTNGYLKKESTAEIFKIQTLNSGDTIRSGMGWDRNWDMDNRRVYEQDGAAEGARAMVTLFPEEKTSIAIMSNALRLRAIEETAHTLAIPFLLEASPQEQPRGTFEITVWEDVRAEWVERKGILLLDGENDRLLIDPDTEREEMYELIYLQRENKYAFIHPDGILYAEINSKEGEKVSGKVMYYRGPNLIKTSVEPPYLRF